MCLIHTQASVHTRDAYEHAHMLSALADLEQTRIDAKKTLSLTLNALIFMPPAPSPPA